MIRFLRRVYRFTLRVIFSKQPLKARRYISYKLGVEKFFTILREKKIKYSILRWFEDLPEIQAGEDIDILIADKDEKKIRHLFCKRSKKGIPCDLYSVSGISGTQFHQIAYFTKKLAGQILDNSYFHKDLYRVPDPENHFLSMAYHAVYHKGYKSGLPESNGKQPSFKVHDHDYNKELKRIAFSAGIKITSVDLRSLDSLLCEKGFRPPRDVLEKLSLRNEWAA